MPYPSPTSSIGTYIIRTEGLGGKYRLASIQPVLNGEAEELVAALEVELLLDVLAVGLDGLDAEEELVGDLAGAEAFPDHAEDFQLAVGEALQRRCLGFGGAGAGGEHAVEHLALDLVANVDLAA